MLIQARQISKSFAGRCIVNKLDMEVREGEILAMIGPNGAGKTTTIEILTSLKEADSGNVSYWSEHYKSAMGIQLQAVPFFPGLTAAENLRLFAAFYKRKLTKKETLDLLKKCGLNENAETEAAKLSGGQQKRLAIAAALTHNPQLIILDEPSAALDPRARQEIHQLMLELHMEGKTILFTSHDMAEVYMLAHRVIMLAGGKIVAEGEPDQLCAQHEVNNLEQLYLKLSAKEETV